MEQSETDYFNGEWIREARSYEQEFVMFHKHGCMQVWHQLHLKSKFPLQDSHIKETLGHIYRKIPILNTAYSYQNGKLWRKKATNPNVEFKTLQNTPLDEVRDLVRNYQYSVETGPLFCGILLKDCLDKNIDPEDLSPDMEHSYYMFFGFHHCIGDATSFFFIERNFLSILNDVIDGKPVGNEPIGTFVIEDETERILKNAMEVIRNDSKLKEKLTIENKSAESITPCIMLGFKAPGGERRTANLMKILDTNTTSTFMRRCKQENLAVASVFTALANVALVDILIQNNFIKDTYNIQNVHLVNVRRYWSKQVPVQDALGCHAPSMKILINTPKITEDQFWDYARSLHQTLHNDIESRRVIFETAFERMKSDESPITEEYVLSEKTCSCDFLISNTGDITDLVTEGGKYVNLCSILGGADIHLLGKPMDIHLLTFRGKLNICFVYNVHIVDKIVVESLFSRILEQLYSINTNYSSSKL